jgi:predicted RecB family nuclease
VVYNASFESRCIDSLARAVPQLAKRLRALKRKLVDLLPIVRDHVYHPRFDGSFSLKQVLPALVPEMGYDDLAVQGGTAASNLLENLLLREAELAPEERQRIREQLLAYCERDTLAMMKLVERLRELAPKEKQAT